MASPDNSLSRNGTAPRVLRFGIFHADRRTNELFRQGVRVKIQEQPMQVLLMLLERPGEIVTREDIRQRLWPADTFVEFDHSVNTAVKKLRQTLGDDADNPRFVETVPRKGYRFIAPVGDAVAGEEAPENASDSPTTPQPAHQVVSLPVTPLPVPRPFWTQGRLNIVLALLGIAVGFGVWKFIHRADPPVTPALEIAPVTTYPGFEDQAQLSPDGQKVAFIWVNRAKIPGEVRRGQMPHIFIKQVGTEQLLQLTKGDEAEFSPAWSPDSSSIAFVRCPPEVAAGTRCGVYTTSTLGGAERLLMTVDSEVDFGTAGLGPILNWSPDGKTIAFIDKSSDNTAAVFLYDVATQAVRQLTFPKPPLVGDTTPAYSPDGKEIAFVRNGKEVSDVWVVKTEGGEPTRLSNLSQIATPGVAWTSDGHSIIFGGVALYRISCYGGKAEVLSNAAFFGNPTIRGKRLVFSQYQWAKGMWAIPLNASGEATAQPQRFLSSTRDQDGPAYSPDGKRIVFGSVRSGAYEIWRADADGSNLLQLTSFKGPLTGTPSFSPDGTTVIFDSRLNGNAHIFSVNAEGGQVKQVTTGAYDDVMPSYSRDGKWIYFPSNRGGSWNVWKMPTAGGDAVQLTHQGGFNGYESSDGKFFYYAKGTTVGGIWRVPVNGGTEEFVVDKPPVGLNGDWFLRGNKIYYGDSPSDLLSNTLTVYSYDLSTKKTVRLGRIEEQPAFGAPSLTVSPDGKTLLVVAQANAGADLMMVDNLH